MLEIHIGNVWSRVNKLKATKEEIDKLSKLLSVRQKGYIFSRSYRLGRWDGFKHFFNRGTGTFYTGLLGYIKDNLPEFEYSEIEERVHPSVLALGAVLNGIKLHKFQEEAVTQAIEKGRGIIASPVNSGKTVMAAGIIKVLGLPANFVTHRVTLLYQTREAFQNMLGIKVGILGDSICEIEDVNILSVATLAQHLPEYKELLKKTPVIFSDECIDGEHFVATQYGYKKLKTLKIGDELITPLGRSRVKDIWKVVKPAYEITLRSGKKFIVSEDHLIPSYKKFSWQKSLARDSDLIIDKVKNSSNFLGFKEPLLFDNDFDGFAYFLGWFIGDGTLAPSICRFGFTKDVDIIRNIFKTMGFSFTEGHCERGDTLFNFGVSMRKRLLRLGFTDGKKSTTCSIPEKYQFNKWTIRGLFEAEGSSDGMRIILDMCSKKCIDQISNFLFCSGIKNTIRGPYLRKDPNHNSIYRVSIFGENVERFHRIVGCSIFRKQKVRQVDLQHKLRPLVQFDAIKSMKEIGSRELYDISLDDEHNLFIVEGYLFHNCHHISGKGWTDILKASGAYYRFGLSATPLMRDDISNLTVRGLTGDEIITVTENEMVDAGISARSSVYLFEIDRPKFKRHTPYLIVYDESVVFSQYRNGLIAKFAKRFLDQGKSVMIVVWRLDHGEFLDNMFNSAGIEHEYIKGGSGETNHTMAVLKSFGERKTMCVVATSIIDEGLNIPAMDVMINAVGDRSPLKTTQRPGRGKRKKTYGENVLTIIDFMDFNEKRMENRSLSRLKVYAGMGVPIYEVRDINWKDVVKI